MWLFIFIDTITMTWFQGSREVETSFDAIYKFGELKTMFCISFGKISGSI